MRAGAIFGAATLLLHALLIGWLVSNSSAPPESATPLPVLAVDMVPTENVVSPQAAEEATAPPSEPPPAIREPKREPDSPSRTRSLPPSPPPPRPIPAQPTPRATPVESLPQASSSSQPGQTSPAKPKVPTDSAETAGTAAPASSTSVYIPADYAASNRKPEYPMLSRRYGEEGTVVLRVLVGADGEARQVDIHASSGHKLLDQSARLAVQSWRFVPATRNGQAVSDWFLIPIPFKLHD